MKEWERSAAVRSMAIDYRYRVSMPIRDMYHDAKVVFIVDVYGVTVSDICQIPGGSEPLIKAVERIGLDPARYQALIWDVAGKRNA
jgi:hypothetical protein